MMLEVVSHVWDEFMRFLIMTFSSLIINKSPVLVSEKPSVKIVAPPRLVYFDIAGLAQSIRDTLTYAEVDFVDERVSKEEFETIKPTLPYHQLPVLHVNDDERTVIAQSKAILRYSSKLAHTYPSNPVFAAMIDQWCDLHTEFMSLMMINIHPDRFGIEKYDKNGHRKWLIKEYIPKYMQILETELEKYKWLGDFDQRSMADICWYPTLKWLEAGTFDGIKADFFDAYPNIKRFMLNMEVTDEEEEEEEEGEGEGEDLQEDEKKAQ